MAEEALKVNAKQLRALQVVGQEHRDGHDDQLGGGATRQRTQDTEDTEDTSEDTSEDTGQRTQRTHSVLICMI